MKRTSWGWTTLRCGSTPRSCGTCGSRRSVICSWPTRRNAWREKNTQVTICQVRKAANVLLDALPLNEEGRKLRLAKAARNIRADQRTNAAARVSHTKTGLKVLKAKGICLGKLRCCIPPRPG
jgi:hypothetical protein